MGNVFDSLHVRGPLTCERFTAPAGSIGDSAVEAAAGIDPTKVIHQFPLHHYQTTGTAVVAAVEDLHIVQGAGGTLVSFEAAVTGAVATGADRTVTVDLHKSTGAAAFASILTAPIVLDDDSVLRTAVAATLASSTLADGDILRVVVTVAGSAGAQAQGLIVTCFLSEDPQ